MQTLGQRLQAEREKKGRSIEELAKDTRIRAQYFEAIEAGRPEEFPGSFFYRSFLRQYAELLELPQSVIEAEIQRSLDADRAALDEREAQGAGPKPDVPPLPTGRIDLRAETQRWLVRLAGLVGVLILCSGLYFAWLHWGQRWFQPRPEPRAATTQPTPARPVETAPPAAVPPVTGQGAPQSSEQGVAQPPAGAAAETEQRNAAPPATAPPGAAPAVTPSAVNGAGAGAAQGNLDIHATADCWVDGWHDGKHFYAAMLHAGESAKFGGSEGLRLRFGNAGAVALSVDGRSLPPLGPAGQPHTLVFQNGEYRPLAASQPAAAKQ